MSVTLVAPDDRVVEEPEEVELERALDALLNGENREADLWLESDSGWALSIVPSGDVFFENLSDEGDNYLTMGPLERADLLRLLHLLANGRVQELRAEPWEEGA